MALTPFGRGTDDLETPRPSTGGGGGGAGGLTAFIDQGSEFEGKLSFRDTVRIDGCFRGEIASENTLIVGESGVIEATIRSNTIVISGSVAGDVHAASKVVLHKTARVEGNIETPSIAVEDGAIVNGQIKMKTGNSGSLKALKGGSSEGKKEEKKAEERPAQSNNNNK
jgi:cytoskeletal protein CcmA (bactofilin family)